MNSPQVHITQATPAWARHLRFALVVAASLLGACGGGGTASNAPQPAPVAVCDPADPATQSACGTLLVGLTDADGDFLSYTVDVLSLTLERADGAVVEVLPRATRTDFSQYVDLTEFVSVATVPPGVYVAGTIRLDYTNAEIFVEDGDAAREAVVVDGDGNALQATALRIKLADRDQLLINRATTSLLTVDFDLDASHTVDLGTMPATAVAEPFIVAELDPVDEKEIRVRGRYIEANEAEMYYTVALRPFHDRHGDFGRMRVYVNGDTDCEIDGDEFSGSECLRALQAAGTGTMTVAQGTLNVATRRFTAAFLLGGSSVPGNGLDAAEGHVISRRDDDFVVRGGTLILSDNDHAHFRDDVTVTVGPGTKVYKAARFGHADVALTDRLLDSGAISVGQRVLVRGTAVNDDERGVHIDATEGAVILQVTRLGGIVNSVVPGQVDIELHSLGGRRPDVYDFTCTGGCEPSTDADPGNYEVATGDLVLRSAAVGQPVAALGFVNAFMGAPPDFEGRTVVDFSDLRSALGIGWGEAGTTAPFLMMDGSGLLLDNGNEAIAGRHFIRKGPVLIDLTALDSNTLIAPQGGGRTLFALKIGDSLQLFANFDDFVAALQLSLNGANTARSLYAHGQYNGNTNVFIAYRIFVHIVEP